MRIPGPEDDDITPEMIEAGALALLDFDPRVENEGTIVVSIYRAMQAVRALRANSVSS